MPKYVSFLIVKRQVESFRALGFKTEFEIQGFYEWYAPKILISKGTKQYRFSDPDWNAVSLQLAKLYGVFKNEKRINQYVRSNRNVTNGSTGV